MRITFITDSFVEFSKSSCKYLFGSSIYLNDLAKNLISRGYCVTVIQMDSKIIKIQRDNIDSVSVVTIPAESLDVFNTQWFKYVSFDSTIVHLNNIDCLPVKPVDFKLTGTVHTNTFMLKKHPNDFFKNFVLPKLSKIVVVNGDYLQVFRDVSDKIIKVNNFVDTGLFEYSVNKPRAWKHWKLVFPSRQVVDKGVFFAIDLAVHLRGNFGWCGKLLLAGEINPVVYEYAQHVSAPCEFLGYQDHYCDMPSIYTDSDIILVPSFSEACGLVALEAMSTGRPVIANNTSGINKVILDGVSGITASLDIPTWSRAVSNLAQDLKCYFNFQETGRRIVEQDYDIDKCTEAYISMWNSLN